MTNPDDYHILSDHRPFQFNTDAQVVDKMLLNPQEGWLYSVIVRHANYQTKVGFPGLKRLAKLVVTRRIPPTVFERSMSARWTFSGPFERLESRLMTIWRRRLGWYGSLDPRRCSRSRSPRTPKPTPEGFQRS